MNGIGQKQFEQEVLFSLMKDSVNILLRTEIRPKGLLLEDADEDDWTARLVIDYLPRMARAVRLVETSVTPASAGEETSFWLQLPEVMVQDQVLAFLRWVIAAGVERGGIAAEAEVQADPVCLSVANKVATMWKTVGF